MGGQGIQGVSSEGLPAAFQCGRRHHMGQSGKMAELALKTSPFWRQRQESTHASPPERLVLLTDTLRKACLSHWILQDTLRPLQAFRNPYLSFVYEKEGLWGGE